MIPALIAGVPLVVVIVVVVIVVGAGVVRDSPIDPVGWNPPEPPEMSGPLAENRELVGADTVVTCEGPEDVAFDDDGRMYTSDDSAVVRTVEPVDRSTNNAQLEPVADTDGRPLGMEFAGDDLIVAAEDAGLLSVSPDGNVTTLTDTADGQHTAFADDLYVAEDGTVYFTDATRYHLFQYELFELRDTGRLLAYHPDSGETTVELEDLGFANGICPYGDGESVLVTETSRYRVVRYWYDGDREGDHETFAENLVGYPDNIEAGGDGTFWVAIPSVREEAFDSLQGRPWLKRQLGKLPEFLIEKVSGDPYGLVLHLDEDGGVIESLHDPDGDVAGITSATPHDDALYLGSLFSERVTRYTIE